MSHSGTGVIESTADGCKTMPGTVPGVLYDSVTPHPHAADEVGAGRPREMTKRDFSLLVLT